MARELEVRVWCDLCLAQGWEPGYATHIGLAVSIGGVPARELDLCQRHHAELVRPLLRVLDRHGHDPERPAVTRTGRPRRDKHRADGPYRCQVAGCLAAPLKHRDTFWQHLKGLHGMTLDEYVELHGELVPMTDAELAELVVEAVCPLCGRSYSTERGNRWPRQALASHTWGHHAVKLGDLELADQEMGRDAQA